MWLWFFATRESTLGKQLGFQAASPKTISNHSKHISKPVLEEAADVSKSYPSRVRIASRPYPNRIQNTHVYKSIKQIIDQTI